MRFYWQKLMIGFCVWASPCLGAVAQIAPALPANSPAVADRFLQVSFGQVLESELKHNERHSYQIPLAAHEFARLEIECAEAGVSLDLLDAAGRIAFQIEFDPQHSQQVVIHATTATAYQIRLSPDAGQTAPKRYRLRWLEKHAATETDKTEFLAQQAKQEAMTLYGQRTTESLRRAVDKCREAARLYETVGARFPHATMFNLLGLTLIRLSERAAAEQALQQARALFRQLGRRDKEINVLDNLSRLATRWGDFQGALAYAQQVMTYARQDGDSLRLMSGLSGLADIYSKSGDQRKAIDLNLEAVALARANRQSRYAYMHEAQAWMGLGQSYFALGDETQGLRAFDQWLPALRQAEMGPVPNRSPVQLAQAEMHLRRGAAQNVLDLLSPWRADEQVNMAQRVRALLLLGQAHLALRQYAEAQAVFRQAESFSQTGGFQDLMSEVWLGLARAARAQLRLDEALALNERAIALIEQQHARIFDADLRATLFASQRAAYALQIELLMQKSERVPAQRAQRQAEALHLSERGRARAFMTLLSNATPPAPLLARQQQLREKLETTAAELSKVPLADQPRRDELNRALTVLTTELNLQYQMQHLAQRDNGEDLSEQPDQSLTLPQIQQQVLDEDTVLLEYALGEERSFLFVATRTALTVFVLPKRAVIETRARRFYQLLTQPGNPPQFRSIAERAVWEARMQRDIQPAAAAFSAMILQPAASLLAGLAHKKRVLIVADEVLHYLPFAALPFGVKHKSGRSEPLIAQHEILTLPSASTLAVLRKDAATREPASKTLMLFADPVFAKFDQRVAVGTEALVTEVVGSENDAASLPRLPASRREAEAIAALVPEAQRTLSLDFAARREAVLGKEMLQYRYVHFATHSVLDTERPELSALALSQVNQQGAAQNGWLRTLDIFNLRLNAELVVLSGCRTALGKEIKGEGLIGLTRGFMHAGARRVVASLWKVNDEVAVEFMQRFYTEMLGAHSLAPAAALRAAQRQMLKDPRWQAPYYWAGFVLQGEW